MRRIAVLDTATASTNLGDQIIMDAARKVVDELFPDAFHHSVASHDYMGAKGRGLVGGAEVAVACGTNLLSSRMWIRSPWKLRPRDAFLPGNVVLMGCGWYQYQRRPDAYSRWLLRRVLSGHHLHAVRDSYSLRNLERIGITNVVNTGCPTLWDLTPEDTARLPKTRAAEVVTTVNVHFRDPAADRAMFDTLAARYDRVHLWVQHADDLDYAKGLGAAFEIVPPSLGALDRLLAGHPSLDYVGNRLHGGIRALQHGRRAVILEVDNRATEMGRDFGLPTLARSEIARLGPMLDAPLDIRVTPPMEAVARWKGQFA
ncbi:polysaccharide pyruvyl transferase family protein [Rhodobacterales bacterium HKCCE2091]|nr:polysaccharide pyruvyl transferase family protein [Rhodobacterales bacterium HKCCE2091]